MNAHMKTAAMPADLKQRLDTAAWDLHHQSRILTVLMEGIEKELFDMKKLTNVDVLSFTHFSHAVHQAYQVVGTANDLREMVDEMMLVTPSVRQAE